MKKLLLLLMIVPMISFGQNPNYSEDIAPIYIWEMFAMPS